MSSAGLDFVVSSTVNDSKLQYDQGVLTVTGGEDAKIVADKVEAPVAEVSDLKVRNITSDYRVDMKTHVNVDGTLSINNMPAMTVAEYDRKVHSGFWKQVAELSTGDDNENMGLRARNMTMSNNGKVVAVGIPNENQVEGAGAAVAIYRENDDGEWESLGAIRPPAYEANISYDYQWSYYSIAMSSDGYTIAVDHSDGKNGKGFVQVFTYDESLNLWAQKGGDIVELDLTGYDNPDGAALYGLGCGLSDDGNTIVIGGPYDSQLAPEVGFVKSYKFVDGEWVDNGAPFLKVENNQAYQGFGFGLAVSGDGTMAAVNTIYGTATDEDGNLNPQQGSVGVYKINAEGTEWKLMGQEMSLGSRLTENGYIVQFGNSVCLSEDGMTMVCNATSADTPGIPSRGSVLCFTYDEASDKWMQKGQEIFGEAAGVFVGFNVDCSADGKRISCVSSKPLTGPNHETITPGAYVYEFDAVTGRWVQLGPKIPYMFSNENPASVAMSANGARVAYISRMNGVIQVYDLQDKSMVRVVNEAAALIPKVAANEEQVADIINELDIKTVAQKRQDILDSQKEPRFYGSVAGVYQIKTTGDPPVSSYGPYRWTAELPRYKGFGALRVVNQNNVGWGADGEYPSESIKVTELQVNIDSWDGSYDVAPVVRIKCDSAGKVQALDLNLWNNNPYFEDLTADNWQFTIDPSLGLTDPTEFVVPADGVIGEYRVQFPPTVDTYDDTYSPILHFEVKDDFTCVVSHFGGNTTWGGMPDAPAPVPMPGALTIGKLHINAGTTSEAWLNDVSFDIDFTGAELAASVHIAAGGDVDPDTYPDGYSSAALIEQLEDTDFTREFVYVPPKTVAEKTAELTAKVDDIHDRTKLINNIDVAKSGFHNVRPSGSYAVDHFQLGVSNVKFLYKIFAESDHGPIDQYLNYVYNGEFEQDVRINVWVPSKREDKDTEFPHMDDVTEAGISAYDNIQDEVWEIESKVLEWDAEGYTPTMEEKQAIIDNVYEKAWVKAWAKRRHYYKTYPCNIDKLRDEGIAETTYDVEANMAEGKFPVHLLLDGDGSRLWGRSHMSADIASRGVVVIQFPMANSSELKPIASVRSTFDRFLNDYDNLVTDSKYDGKAIKVTNHEGKEYYLINEVPYRVVDGFDNPFRNRKLVAEEIDGELVPVEGLSVIESSTSFYGTKVGNQGYFEQLFSEVKKCLDSVPGLSERLNYDNCGSECYSAGGNVMGALNTIALNGGQSVVYNNPYNNSQPALPALTGTETRMVQITTEAGSFPGECGFKLFDSSNTQVNTSLTTIDVKAYENIEIRAGETYRLVLTDSWGDGWQGSKVVFTPLADDGTPRKPNALTVTEFTTGGDKVNGWYEKTMDLTADLTGGHDSYDAYGGEPLFNVKATVNFDPSWTDTASNPEPGFGWDSSYHTHSSIDEFACPSLTFLQSGITGRGYWASHPAQIAIRNTKPSILKESVVANLPSNEHSANSGQDEEVYGYFFRNSNSEYDWPQITNISSQFGGVLLNDNLPPTQMRNLWALRRKALTEMFLVRNLFPATSGQPEYTLKDYESTGIRLDINPYKVDGCETYFTNGIQLGPYRMYWDPVTDTIKTEKGEHRRIADNMDTPYVLQSFGGGIRVGTTRDRDRCIGKFDGRGRRIAK